MDDPMKKMRSLLKIYLFRCLQEKFKYTTFGVYDAACLLQGASLLSGPYAEQGSDSYMLVAWDILGCMEEDGHILRVRKPLNKVKKPWNQSHRWRVGLPDLTVRPLEAQS